MKAQDSDNHRVSVLGTHGRLSKPVEVGSEYNVEITDRGKSGTTDGIARIQGLVIFIKGGKVGDRVRIRITSIGERFARAELAVSS